MSDFRGLQMQSDCYVVFDLDGTLFRGNSFHRWLIFSAFSGESRLKMAARFRILRWCVMRFLRLIPHTELKRRVMLDATVPGVGVDAFVKSWLLPHLSPGCIVEIQRWKAQGAIMILATAAPECYAKEVGTHLGFMRTLASNFGRDGIFFENIGHAKLGCVLSSIDKANLRAVYSDHPDDIPLLEKANHRYLVNPKRNHLKKMATHFGAGNFVVIDDHQQQHKNAH